MTLDQLDKLIDEEVDEVRKNGVTEEEFLWNELLQDATLRQLEILGEAARKVSQETKNVHPEIPWPEMIGLRNRLIHEYSRVNLTESLGHDPQRYPSFDYSCYSPRPSIR